MKKDKKYQSERTKKIAQSHEGGYHIQGKEEFKSHLSRVFKEYKQMRGMTYEEIGEKLDYTDSYIQQVVTGNTNPGGWIIYRIAKALRIPSSQLFPNLQHEELDKYNEKYGSVISKAFANNISPAALSNAIDMIVNSRQFEE